MYPMDLLVDYIYRGVGTFSGPFHPFGGAVDIVVVQQPDGTFKSSPWYVRFGKFQGVLKSKEKIVNISINGNEASFHMHLDSKGEAFFLHTAELDEKEEKICEGEKKNGQINEGQIVKKTVSNRPSIFGFIFGRSSIKIKPDGLESISSLQRAEFAAELLDNNWSTNLSLRDWREGQSSSSNLEGQDENSFVNDNTANEEVHSRGDESDSANLGGQIENLVNDGSENTTTRSEPDLEKSLEESIGSNQIKDVISFPENSEDLQFNSSDGERETETENKTHEKEESIESDENEETDNHNRSTDIETRYESSPICIPSTSISSTRNINLNMAISLPIIRYDYTSDSESFESITRLSSSLTFNPDFKRENANLSLSLQPGPVFNEPEPIMGEELDVRAEIQSPAGGSSWWRFGFSRSRSESSYSVVRNLEEIEGVECKNGVKKVRSLTPSSDEIASLGLKKGRNIVTFTFYTPMLGKQQVDARIYLWNYDSRIVISDVDGTITKSDVLGQFMPLVGVDWCHIGVAHLFSAIKDNEYQFLFLSARAISQAHLTRNFLFNLKQDGKALPDGPVVISPDGLFPSLYREVIRRAPHEFKIACLEAIKALFPVDNNPFYAGFGNRDTDELSYLKVGIPIGKIFIINPKGEVAVNRRVDTKSYSSLHELVHGMFPPYSSSEQEVYNDYNYWKVPLPQID